MEVLCAFEEANSKVLHLKFHSVALQGEQAYSQITMLKLCLLQETMTMVTCTNVQIHNKVWFILVKARS